MTRVSTNPATPTEPVHRAEHDDRRRLLGGAVLILASTLICYALCLPGEFLWDDNDHFLTNEIVRSWAGLPDIWFKPGATINYFPLTFTSFWALTKVFGEEATGYRLVNIAIHVASSVLIWRLLRRLGVPGAFVIGMIFALHPVHVQSVAWITELKNTQSSLFFFLATYAYLRYQPPEADATPHGSRRRWYFMALGAFFCAVLSKSNMAVWVAVPPILLWWKRGEVRPRDLLPLLPFVVIGAAMATFTVFFERLHIKSVGQDWSYTLPERFILAGRACWFYVQKMTWPDPLIFLYPKWKIDGKEWIQYLWPITFVAFLGALWALRTRIGRGPLAAMLYFSVAVFPALGFFNIYGMRYSQVYDYFQYPASLGVIVLVVGAGANILERHARGIRLGQLMAIAACVVLGIHTFSRASVYRGLDELWRDTIRQNPDAWLASNNLANMLLTRNEFPEALMWAEMAAKSAPHVPETFSNIGTAKVGLGDFAGAAEAYEKALSLRPRWPAFLNNYALILVRLNRLGDAAEQMRIACEVQPEDFNIRANYAILLLKIGRAGDAVATLGDAVRSPKAPPLFRVLLARAHFAQGKTDEGNATLRALENDFAASSEIMRAVAEVRASAAKTATTPPSVPATQH